MRPKWPKLAGLAQIKGYMKFSLHIILYFWPFLSRVPPHDDIKHDVTENENIWN